MAVQAKTITNLSTVNERNCHIVSWAALANGDSGDPLQMGGSVERSVQVTGTFGAGGTIVIEGSNDGTNYATIEDSAGTALSKTAAFVEAIGPAVRYLRPRVTAGDGTTALVVTLFAKR